AVLAHAVAAGLGLEMLLVAVIDQGVQPVHRLHPDVAAPPAVAAVGPAELDEFFAAKRHRAAPAVAGSDIDFRLVQEFHDPSQSSFAALRQYAGPGPASGEA